MKRVERKLFTLNDRLASIAAELEKTRAELDYHRSINDDAQRDALVGNYIDREEAGATAADVRRFEKTIESLEKRQAKLEVKRQRLVERI